MSALPSVGRRVDYGTTRLSKTFHTVRGRALCAPLGADLRARCSLDGDGGSPQRAAKAGPLLASKPLPDGKQVHQRRPGRALKANENQLHSGVSKRSAWTSLAFKASGKALQLEQLWNDIREVCILAGPILAQYVVAHSSQMIDTSFVGHLDNPVLLSSVVLAGSLAMTTGYHIVCGLASASETLSGQAHGAGNRLALGLTLQRSVAVCAMAAVPITALWWHGEPILISLGQAPEIAAGAARYLRLTLPALYSFMVFRCVDKHLLAQGVVAPGVAITTLSTAMTPVYCWFFVNHLGLQLDGAAYAYCCTQATATALSLSYLTWRARATAGQPDAMMWAPSAAALNPSGWRPYLELALPATLMGCMEGWAVEVLIFLSGNLSNPEVAVGVTGLCLQFSTLVWLSASSISSATSTKVANCLGKGDAVGAQRLAYTSLGLVLVSQALIGLAALGAQEQLVGLMTSRREVLDLTRQVMPVLALCFIFDGQNVVLSSILRGAGRQWLGAGCNLVGWWAVGVPLAWYLGLPAGMGMGVRGIWAGFTVASGLQAVVQWAVIVRLDWQAEVRRAGEMVRGSVSGDTGAVSVASAGEKKQEGMGSGSGDGISGGQREAGADTGAGAGTGTQGEAAVRK